MKSLFEDVNNKLQTAWKSAKGRTVIISGGSAIAGIILVAIVFANISTTSEAVNRKFTTGKSISSTSSAASASATSSSIPVVSAAPAPSGAAPTAAEALHTIPVTSVDFNHRSLTLKVGATTQITPSITPSNATDKTLAWTSSDSSVATVDSNGVITVKSAGTALVRATNADGQRDTCTVTVPAASAGDSGNAGGGTATGNAGCSDSTQTSSAAGHVANYQGVNETKTYTDEITGITQTVQFLGVGAGYREVACGNAEISTSADLGAAHYGPGTASISGPVNQTAPAVVGRTGTGSNFVFGNLIAGSYTVQLTAHDGTVVARYHFTVDSGGNVQ